MSDATRRNRWHLVNLALAMTISAAVYAGDSFAADSGNESIGDQLLDDLDPSLFSPPETAPSDGEPVRPDFPKRILPGVTDDRFGEDIGQPSADNPLASVERTMRSAEALIRDNDPRLAAGEQQEAVAQLDRLIEQLSKQCCSGACKPTDQQNPTSQRSQAGSGKPVAKPGHGNSPARDSSSRLGRNNSEKINVTNREQLQKALWGHLPSRVREQMLESHTDEFLPEYELEIERYFRRLAEEPNESHSQ